MRTASVYGLIDPRNSHLRYIGQSVNVQQRAIAHFSEAHRGSHLKVHQWISGLGGMRPELLVLETLPIAEIKAAEKFWIAYFRSLGCRLLNLTDGGDTVSYACKQPKSAEHRAKLSASGKATRRGLKPVKTRRPRAPMSAEAREKIRQGQIKYHATAEAKAKYAAPRKPHTAERKANIGAKSRGRTHSAEYKRHMAEVMRQRRAERPGADWYIKTIDKAGSFR